MRPRVVHVLEAVEAGVVRHVADVVEHVAAEHHVVHPAVRVGGLTDRHTLDRIAGAARVHTVPMRRSTVSATNAAAIGRLRSLLAELAPDVVHGHSTVGGAVARLAAARTGVPTAYTAHGLSPRRAARAAERLLGPLTDRWIAVSPTEAALARRRGLADRGLTVVANGIDPAPPPPATPALCKRLGLPPTTPLVGTVGRIAPQKAPETMIAAWDLVSGHHPDVHFVWMGDGEGRAAAEAARERATHRARIHLLGHVPEADRLLDALAVFCLSSHYEGAPYVLLEAMRAGVAVVATDVVGTRDVVADGETGVLVPAGQPVALADAVDALLADQPRRAACGAAGRERVRSAFTVGLMADRLAALYEELAAGKG